VKIIAVIPAHLASVRFPRKILYPIHNLPMIEHVRRRALLSNEISRVIVATCDNEIANVIRGYGGEVVMTANTHTNGTTRVAEAISDIECSHVMLLQGDEPLLLPNHINSFVDAIKKEPDVKAWNATGPIDSEDELDRHSFVKCAVSHTNEILYCFRRSPCYSDFIQQKRFVRKILGIIAYRKDYLLQLALSPVSAIEQAEFIEQMRIVENGVKLKSIAVNESLPSINEPQEADIVKKYISASQEQKKILQAILNQDDLPA
jgi:3-deoxy-manno-octulosonate cytidylyltransferase (CMP-KDO synthetase)